MKKYLCRKNGEVAEMMVVARSINEAALAFVETSRVGSCQLTVLVKEPNGDAYKVVVAPQVAHKVIYSSKLEAT